jgi:hypothetical protein
MNYISGNCASGAFFSTTTLLSPSTSYSYYFEAQDKFGIPAVKDPTVVSGDPTNASNNIGPDVQARISGTITTYYGAPLVNRQVNLFGSVSTNTYTDSTGAFAFTSLETGGSYTVFPASNTFCYFDNAYITENPLTADVTMQFLKMSDVKPASGYIKDPAGNALGGINMSLSGTHCAACASDNTGRYCLYVTTEAYSLAVSTNNPSCYLFSPSSYTLNNITSPTVNLSFSRLNRPPVLACTGEAGYTSSALGPASPAVNQNIAFRVMYSDPDNDAPKTNFPMVYILQSGATAQTLSLSPTLTSTYNNGAVYSGTISFSKAGNYSYNILADDCFGALGNVYCGSFQVSSPKPGIPENISRGLTNGESVTSGQAVFSWECANPNNDVLTYTLYLSNPISSANAPLTESFSSKRSEVSTVLPSSNIMYSGPNTSYTLTSLESGMVYYWQVQASNQYNAASLGPVYSFTTIKEPKKAFNYPNPFNPARNQKTNIVFEMAEDGDADITVFSEFGNRCWGQNVCGLNKGTNQVSYDGRDDSGNTMYNGTYPCVIKKRYANGEQDDHCRLLIIK